MQLFYIVFYISLFIWLFPPFRQHNTRYFWFFLILAISDPLMYLLYITIKLPFPHLYLITGFAAALSLISNQYLLKYRLGFSILAALIIAISCQNLIKIHIYILAFVEAAMLSMLIQQLKNEAKQLQTINMFSVVIIFYVITLFEKSIFHIFSPQFSYKNTIVVNIIEVFLCLYFIMFNHSNSKKFVIAKMKRSINHEFS